MQSFTISPIEYKLYKSALSKEINRANSCINIQLVHTKKGVLVCNQLNFPDNGYINYAMSEYITW